VQAATASAVKAFTSGSPTDPTTPLGQLTAQCAAPFGAAASQHAAQINACVQGGVQQYAQTFAQTYAQQHGAQLAAGFAAQYIQQHVFPIVATHALNDTFMISLIGCAAATVLAFFLGSDPSVQAAKEAKARGEKVETRPAAIGE
jgi:hypothetical protein